MTLADFQLLREQAHPPAGMSPALQALWFASKGDWEKAHELAQQDGGADGAWVHAYLHRQEGDNANAGYWYSRAGKPACSGPLKEEWAAISEALLGKS